MAGWVRPISHRMGRRAASAIRSAENRPVCPTCGRGAVGTVTGLCIYCLNVLPGAASRVEAGKILRLSEFERVRGQVKRSRGSRRARSATAGLVGVVAGGILIGLFYLCMKWLEAFFGRGMSWRQ